MANQEIVKIYRKWYIEGYKKKGVFFDCQQINDLLKYNIFINSDLINTFINTKQKAFRGKIPIFLIRNSETYKFISEFLFIDNTIISLNTSGCLSFGDSKKDTIINYLKSMIECLNYRDILNVDFNDWYYYLHIYSFNPQDITSEEMIKMQLKNGWYIGHEYHYNTILKRENYPSTITIPNNKTIPGTMALWIEKMNFPMTGKAYYDNYGFTDNKNEDIY